MMKDVTEARPGDIIRFRSYALRVDTVEHTPQGAKLTGRKSTDGCPIVTKSFIRGSTFAIIERAEP